MVSSRKSVPVSLESYWPGLDFFGAAFLGFLAPAFFLVSPPGFLSWRVPSPRNQPGLSAVRSPVWPQPPSLTTNSAVSISWNLNTYQPSPSASMGSPGQAVPSGEGWVSQKWM